MPRDDGLASRGGRRHALSHADDQASRPRDDWLRHDRVTDADFDDLAFATLDLGTGAPEATVIASMAAECRGLAYDGITRWSNLRDIGGTMSFRL